MKKTVLAALALLPLLTATGKTLIDFSRVYVPEEGGIRFEKITDDADCVFSDGLVSRDASSWWAGTQIALSPDGWKIAYINNKNNMQNIMVKPSIKGGASVQRTFRAAVEDLTWSRDGKTLCFTEYRNGHNGIYMTNADQGSVVRQISNGNENDFSGIILEDGNTIMFTRSEGKNSYSLWSYDFNTHLFSNYSRGITPCPIPGKPNEIYCGRLTNKNEGEIWRVNFETGVEELILGQPGKSFTTPQLSPDGKWLLCTGVSLAEKEQTRNTDIYAVRTDGTQLTQLTYHPGNDLSAIWSSDGRSIYFLSQRGSADRVYNVWKMDFTHYQY